MQYKPNDMLVQRRNGKPTFVFRVLFVVAGNMLKQNYYGLQITKKLDSTLPKEIGDRGLYDIGALKEVTYERIE